MDPVADAESGILTFMPGEVCVVLRSTEPIDEADVEGIYEALGHELGLLTINEHGDRVLPRLREARWQVRPFVLFTPTEALTPTKALTLTEEKGPRLLCFYLIPEYPEDPEALADKDVVVKLVGLTNRYVTAANDELAAAARGGRESPIDPRARAVDRRLTVEAYTQNWLLGAHWWEITPGPAAPPEPAPAGLYDWVVQDAQLRLDQAVAGDKQPGENPVVAVLDTSPEPGAINAPHFHNWLLDKLNNEVPVGLFSFGGTLSTPGSYFTADPILRQTLARWRGHSQQVPGRPIQDFDIRDHGLAVAGIVRSIAPRAPIHLIRVLSDYGVGDELPITNCLAALPAAFMAGGRRLVTNLSLGAAFPLGISITNPVQMSLRNPVETLSQNGALIAAAAGNDADDRPFQSWPGPGRPDPRLPAAYPFVCAVGAVRRDENAAEYSNMADTQPPFDDTAAFGGNAVRVPAASPPRTLTNNGAALSLYTAPTFPLSLNAANNSGWAYWAGTSFATPVISALAANRWAHDSIPSSQQVRTYLTGRAQISVSPNKGAAQGALNAFCLSTVDVDQT